MSAESQKARAERRAETRAQPAQRAAEAITAVALVPVEGGYSARRYLIPLEVLEQYEVDRTTGDLRGFAQERAVRMLGVVPR